MKYGTFDRAGKVTGHYSEDIHGIVPAEALQMSNAEWLASCAGEIMRDISGQRWINKPARDPLDIAREIKLSEILEVYLGACTGSVVCGNYIMDAGEENARRLDDGCRLAERLGQETITVTDFYNVDHAGVSIADARDIATLQGVHFATAREKKNALRKQVLDAKSLSELDAIKW